MNFRTDKDSLGAINIPADALYGTATQRAVNNFNISEKRFGRSFIRALALIKWAGAKANAELGTVDEKLARSIASIALEVADGKHDAHFVLDIFQTGSGTSTNMNANEVIANLANKEVGSAYGANKPVHPNDHVNRGQSSNDVIPSAIHVAAAVAATEKLLPAAKQLQMSLARRAADFETIVKIGRTHLQDATPVTLGQEFSGYARQVELAIKRIASACQGVQELAIGGTAVGTGINTHPQFAGKVCAHLAQKTGVKFTEAVNHFEAQAAKDACVFLSGALKTLSVSLMKIANDLRWLSSGPRCGIGEISIPELQAGSSIMPGKNNPVICESVMQISAQVQGNDLTVQLAGQHGNFELNVMMPVLAASLLESIDILSAGMVMFAEKCVDILEPNEERNFELVEKSLMLITSLTPVIGYDKAAFLAKRALKEGKTIRELLAAENILPKDQIDKLLDPKTMLRPKG